MPVALTGESGQCGGGLPESLVNLYAITGNERYLAVALRFYHVWFLDPLAAGRDDLAGEQCNVNTPKITATLRMWEVIGAAKYHDIAENFWQFARGQHSYVTGGQGDHEHWNPPGVIAAALSNYTCEGCVTYNNAQADQAAAFPRPVPDRRARLMTVISQSQLG